MKPADQDNGLVVVFIDARRHQVPAAIANLIEACQERAAQASRYADEIRARDNKVAQFWDDSAHHWSNQARSIFYVHQISHT